MSQVLLAKAQILLSAKIKTDKWDCLAYAMNVLEKGFYEQTMNAALQELLDVNAAQAKRKRLCNGADL